jgi:hypothetical protein
LSANERAILVDLIPKSVLRTSRTNITIFSISDIALAASIRFSGAISCANLSLIANIILLVVSINANTVTKTIIETVRAACSRIIAYALIVYLNEARKALAISSIGIAVILARA